MSTWYDKYKGLDKIIYSSFGDFTEDYKKKNKNYWHIFYDIIGIIGMLLLLITYVIQIYHIIKYKKFYGFPVIYFYIRLIGFMMLFLYAYFRKDFEGEVIMIATFITVVVYSVYIKYLT